MAGCWVRITGRSTFCLCQSTPCTSILSAVMDALLIGCFHIWCFHIWCFHKWPISCKEKTKIVPLKEKKPDSESKQDWDFMTFWGNGSVSVIAVLQNWTDVYGSHKKGNEGRLHQNILEALNNILGCYSEGHLLLLSAQYCAWPSQDGKKKWCILTSS